VGTKFKILIAIASGLMLLSACSMGHPNSAYFSQLEIEPHSQSQGVIKLVLNTEWIAWQKKEQVSIKEYGILSLNGVCSGRVSGERIEYKAEIANKTKVVFRGGVAGEASCLVDDSRTAQFVIFPVLEKQSALSDGDLTGELYFSLPLNLQIR
jgi:hypothetical protein